MAGVVRFLRCVSGNTWCLDDGFIRNLKEGIPGLKEESNVENCNVILVFCPIHTRAGTDIQSALKKLQNLSESKPAVLVVLYHVFDQDMVVPDSSRSVNRENTLTVDCLFQEDNGLLQCYRNQEALKKVTQWIKSLSLPQRNNSFSYFWNKYIPPRSTAPDPKQQKENSEQRLVKAASAAAAKKAAQLEAEKAEEAAAAATAKKAAAEALREEREDQLESEKAGVVRFLHCVSGNTLGSDKEFIRKLKEGIPCLKEEFNVENCDVILTFCPVDHRQYRNNIESAVKNLQHLSESKRTVLVVLYHTIDPEAFLPDSSRRVTRVNTLTVDCLFHKNKGLLQSQKNQQALEKVTQWIKPPFTNKLQEKEILLQSIQETLSSIKNTNPNHLEDEQHANLIKHLREIEQELKKTSAEVKIPDGKTPTNKETICSPPPPNTSKDPLNVSAKETEEGFISYEKDDDKKWKH